MQGVLHIHQVAALPYRQSAKPGKIEILLVTSRDTGRWVLPKGNLMEGLTLAEAATVEALEEAGVAGVISPDSIGSFHYEKRRGDGSVEILQVQLFPMLVTQQAQSWPEMHQRQRKWFKQNAAAKAVAEAELSALLRAFIPAV